MTTNDPGPYSSTPGNQPPWAGRPAYPPPPAPPTRSWPARHKVLTAVLAVVGVFFVLGGIGAALSPAEEETADVAAASSPTPAAKSSAKKAAAPAVTKAAETTAAEPKAPGIGQSVRDGKFEFTVTKVKCGVPNVGGEYGVKADGQFCLVTMKVENIGDKAQLLDASSQYGYDAADRKLSADGAAGIYANQDGGGAFLNDINPGNSASAVIVFDVPKGAKLTRLELHDSPFSGGVDVALG